jgi:thiamine biosynthesis lipoprotein
MRNRTFAGLVIAAVLTLAALAIAKALYSSQEMIQWKTTFPVMGTVASFTLYTTSEKLAEEAAQKAQTEFQKVVSVANLYDKDSELSRLNASASGEEFHCSPEMWKLLMRAQRAYTDSNGVFDITVKPLMDLWGFYRKRQMIPSPEAIDETLKRVGFNKVILDPEKRSVRFTVPQMALDLGGIAKGYAADRAAAAIVATGITSGVVDLGGNLKLLPSPPPGRNCYIVGIRKPGRRGEIIPDLLMDLPPDCAIATSGDYERFVVLNGKTYGHIINPKSGIPEANRSVSVITSNALDADVFSTSAYLGKEKTAEFLKRKYPGTSFVFTE